MNKAFKNVIPVLSLMLISIMFSCTHKKIKKDSVIVPTEDVSTPTPAPTTPPLSVELGVANVKLTLTYGLRDYEIALIKKAQDKMNEVVQSSCFYNYISNRKMIQTNGMNSKQVAEFLQNIKGEVPVSFFYKAMKTRLNPFGSSVVAVRYPPSTQINFNRAYYGEGSNLCEFSGTAFHETSHALGEFDHDYYESDSRYYSVPYSINAAFEKCCH